MSSAGIGSIKHRDLSVNCNLHEGQREGEILQYISASTHELRIA